jgi:thiamine biosynthesis lipoprotein
MGMNAHFECDGIGTHWWFELLDTMTFPPSLRRDITQTIEQFDADYSRFRPDSYLGRLNRDKVLHNPPEELLAMMQFAKRMYTASEGAFNISVGGALHAAGYGSRKLAAAIDTDFWENVVLRKDIIRIPTNAVIDNGGFGKGWLIDRLGDLFRARGFDQFVINGGGDILVSSDVPIEFALEHPTDTHTSVGTTRLTHGALAVSANNKRTWQHAGRVHQHIIDPIQGTNRTYPLSSYVRAESALLADTMATILLLRPELEQQLSKQFGLKSLFYQNANAS